MPQMSPFLKLLFVHSLLFVAGAVSASTLRITGNSVVLDGKRGAILRKASADLDRDGRIEYVFALWLYDESFGGYIVARPGGGVWRVVAKEYAGIDRMQMSVSDVNGDQRPEIIWRAMSGDGHMYCFIDVLAHGRIKSIGDFNDTKFRDLDGDGVPEVLSVEMVSAGFVGDHWLTIYKWTWHGYVDVSRRFPGAYRAVIRDLRDTIYQMRYTRDYGHTHSPKESPEVFSDLYYYLGKAHEFNRHPERARMPYAIAYRLQPDDGEKAAAFRRAWGIKKPKTGQRKSEPQ